MKSVEIYFHSIREDVERLLKRKKEKEGVENGRITVRLLSRLVLQKEKVGKNERKHGKSYFRRLCCTSHKVIKCVDVLLCTSLFRSTEQCFYMLLSPFS